MKNITLTLVVLLLLGANLTAQETKAIDLMSKALYEENISADYAKASLIYQQVLKDFSQDKKACGQATYRLGLCAEKLGQVKAQEYFQSVVENFSDQQDLVNLARAKLNNSGGAKYFTDERDGKKYKYVTVGRQVWMAENLAYMPKVSQLKEQGGIWVNDYNGTDTAEARRTDNYLKYGCLYDFEEAKKSCPAGWHLSTNADWLTLERYLGFDDPTSNRELSGQTKGAPKVNYIINSADGQKSYQSNLTGLSLSRSGIRIVGGSGYPTSFSYFSSQYWVSSSEQDHYSISLGGINGYARGYFWNLEYGMSVRCVRNSNGISRVPAHPSKLYQPLNGERVIGLVNIQVGVEKTDLVDSVKLFIQNGNQIQLICTDYSSLGSYLPRSQNPAFDLGWDTYSFKDGRYQLSVITYHYGDQQDTLNFSLEVVNKYPIKKDGEFVDIRDGKVYPFVNIGKASWMAKNLDFIVDEGSGSFCYNDLVTNCRTYGRLYTHKTALKACPTGWHLPSNDEWLELEISLGMDTTMLSDGRYYNLDKTGQKVKSEIGWQNQLNITTKEMVNGAGTNESGLNILPGGYLKGNFGYSNRGDYTSLWTSSVDEKFRPQYRSVQSWPQCIDRDYDREGQEANYVRCIKDTPPTKN
jgi:uncharacterized protein (TIGR02145 family)